MGWQRRIGIRMWAGVVAHSGSLCTVLQPTFVNVTCPSDELELQPTAWRGLIGASRRTVLQHLPVGGSWPGAGSTISRSFVSLLLLQNNLKITCAHPLFQTSSRHPLLGSILPAHTTRPETCGKRSLPIAQSPTRGFCAICASSVGSENIKE